MKSKCSFILKSGIALILCFLMLFGTVTTSLAAVVENADTGAEAEDIADTGADADLAESGYYWSGGTYYMKGSFNNWGELSGTNNSSNTQQHYYYIYAPGSSSNADITFKFKEENGDGNNSWFGAGDTNSIGTTGKQIYENGGSDIHLNRKNLGTTSTTWYKVKVWFEHASDCYCWYEIDTTKTALTPTLTTKNGSTSTTSFTIGDTVSLSTSTTQNFGTVTYSYEYKKSTDSSYTSISGTTLDTSSLTAGTYTIRVTANDGAVVSGTNAESARTATTTKDITLAAPACAPKIRNEAGTAELSNTTIYSRQQLKFTVYDPNSHTSTLSITKGGTAQTASTYLSSTTSVASGTVVTFTPTALDAGASDVTYVITQSCSGSGSDTVTITVKAEPTIYFNWKLGGSGTNNNPTMTYDADASAAMSGGKADHVLYKLSISNWTKNKQTATENCYYIKIFDGSDRYTSSYTSSVLTTSLPRTGDGVALSNTGDSYFRIGTRNTSASSAGTYNFYYDFITKKFYVEYPVQITYVGRCGSTNVRTEYAMIDYGATPSTNKTLTKPTGYTQTSATAWYTNNTCTTAYTAAARTTDLTIYTPFTADQYTVTLDANTNGGKITKTSGGSAANTATFTHTYGVAQTIADQYYSVTPPTGYTFDGWYDEATGGTMYTSVGATAISDAKTYYAHYTEVKAGVQAQAFTNGSKSSTGGTVNTSNSTGAATKDYTVGIATTGTVYAIAKNGYNFTGWAIGGTNASHVKLYTDSTCNTLYTSGTNNPVYIKTDGTAGLTTADAEVHALFVAKTTSITLDKNSTAATNGSVTSITGTYDAAMTDLSGSGKLPTRPGYTFAGYYDASSGGTMYIKADGTSNRTWDKTNASKTLYAHWTEIKYGATIKAYTNGSASGTGGSVKYNTGSNAATATISDNTFGIDTKSAVITATKETGYDFKGWKFNNTHLKYSFDGTTFNAVTSTSDTYGTSSNTTVYLKTDGTSGLTGLEAWAMFETSKYTITYSGKYTDDGTTWNAITDAQGTFTVKISSTNVASGSTVDYNSNLTITATPAAGYVVDGIYQKNTAEGVWEKMGTTTDGSAVLNNTFNVKANWIFEARFKKIYHISLYNTTEEVGGDFRYVTGPPMRVTATPSGGTAVTYTYKKNASATSEGNTRTSGDYNEGDLLTVYAGDTIVLSYAALASSDTITGVFFNNARRYTCEGQNDNLYKLREYKAAGWGTDGDDSWDYDYMAATTLYANQNYYEGATATTIAGQFASYQAKDGVDNNMHTVTFVAKSDYLNIDLEIATKRQFIFTDETGLDIRSEMMDNYYNPLSEVSASSATTKFGIKLATSDTCTYDWGTGDKVKFYRDADCTTEVTGVFTVASSADSDGYYVISGTMPNYNVYIKPNIVTKYQVSLGTVMLADVSSNNYQYWNQAADVSLNYGGTKYKNEKYDGITAPSNCIKAITKGDTVTFISSNYNDKTQYTFLGWYKGTSTGPDYKNGLLSEKETFNFIPRENTYVYAVGTRDLFINGSKYITGATNDWNRTGDNDPVNFKMEFDPTKGTKGMYYWELDAETLYAAVASTGYTNGGGIQELGGNNDKHYYWNDSYNMGNSWFQIMDSPTGWDRSAVWGANDGSDFKTTETNKIEYGKVRKGTEGNDWKATEACGYIKFKESDSPGWSAPLRIYVDPTATGVNKGRFTVEPTPTYSNLYVSNGFDVGGTSRDTATSVTVPTGETSFTIKSEGDGWDPDHEGHVQHYIPQKKNAKVRITKTCSANEQVVAFDVFDIDNDDFYSRTDVTASGNNYYIDFQCTMQQNLYIVPVVQEKSADLTIKFDGTQLNKTQWGEIVTAYAWYSDGSSTHALGAYPGQPMVIDDDGNTWTAAIPSTRTISSTKYSLAGILFTNYVDGNHSWLGCGSVMGTEQNAGTQSISTTGGIIQTYNIMKDTDYRDGTYHGTYNKANFKAQTYDYREPVAIYNNAPKGEGVKTTITFAMKDGDSSLISWRHSELTGNNILNLPSGWTPLRWEYLTNSTGKKYSDLNGHAMEGTPTATYYIAAKGQVIYKNDSMTKVYYGGKDSDAPSPAVSYGLSGTSIDFNYAVQWYVYDAQGNYITNVLSAAFADQKDGMSYIAKQLDDLGYAVDGKSVAICYDKPRYMYQDTGGVINSGENFDAYRFEGQWYATVQTEPVTVSVGVGMMTENGEVIADTNHPGYGDATAAYSTTYGTASYAHSSDGDKSVTVALADASKRLVKLDANATNFVGWYYYDANTNKFTKASYKNATDFYPNFNADVTYYAMYEAKAVYQYNYTGREGAKTFSVAGGALTDAEMTDGNKVSTLRTDFGSKSPGASNIKVFKKDITFNTTVTSGMLNNTTPYIMNITNSTITDASYEVTAHYRDASGDLHDKAITAVYNTPVDFTTANGGAALTTGYTGHRFLGWFECDENGEYIGSLLSTQSNYGMVAVKDQHIIAVYEDDGSGKTVSGSDVFSLFADDHEITKEQYSASTGTYYNDTIIRLRNDSTGNLTSLPSNAEVGILVINANDSGQSTVVSNADNLITFANGLTNGQTATVGNKGRTVTKISTTTLNTFGRADLAIRCDYGTVNGTAYSVYAYYKNPSGAYTFTTVKTSGTYTID